MTVQFFVGLALGVGICSTIFLALAWVEGLGS